MHWQLFKGVVLISLIFCMFSVPFPYTGLLFFLSLAASTLLVVKAFYPAAVRTGMAAGMAILINMAVWFVFHSVIGIIQSMGFLAFAIIVIALFMALAPRMRGVTPIPYINLQPPTNYSYYQNGVLSIDLYHGTPDLNNLRDILDYGSGFIVGQGNSYGTGVYFAEGLQVAKQYVRGTGGIVRVNLQVPGNQIADYYAVVSSNEFKRWCSTYGNGNVGDNITGYTIGVLHQRFIRLSSYGVYIALARVTIGNERVTFEGVTILGGLDTQGNPI